MLKPNPKERFTLEQCASHPWMRIDSSKPLVPAPIVRKSPDNRVSRAVPVISISSTKLLFEYSIIQLVNKSQNRLLL